MSPERILVVSDIHGEVGKFRRLLDLARFDRHNDGMVIIGDMIDRGPESIEVVQLVRSLQADNPNIEAMVGNHEDMMMGALIEGSRHYANCWYANGGLQALRQFLMLDKRERHDILEWMQRLPIVIETAGHIFVHAFFDPRRPTTKQDRNRVLWEPVWARDLPEHPSKTIVFGHYRQYGQIKHHGKRICIDTGACFGGPLAGLIIKNDNLMPTYEEVYAT